VNYSFLVICSALHLTFDHQLSSNLSLLHRVEIADATKSQQQYEQLRELLLFVVDDL
jgi:hypothetical protein